MNTVTDSEMSESEDASEGGSSLSEDSKEVFFLKPKEVSRGVYKYPIPRSSWEICEFWILTNSTPAIVTFKTEDQNFSTEYTLDNSIPKGFVRVPIFKGPFPLWQVKFQQCCIMIQSEIPRPMYIIYRTNLENPGHLILMDHYQGSTIRFADGCVDYYKNPQEEHKESPIDLTISYAGAMEDLVKKISKATSHPMRFSFDVAPSSAPNYLKALVDMGFRSYSVAGFRDKATFTFSA